jgi:hypothetical protein
MKEDTGVTTTAQARAWSHHRAPFDGDTAVARCIKRDGKAPKAKEGTKENSVMPSAPKDPGVDDQEIEASPLSSVFLERPEGEAGGAWLHERTADAEALPESEVRHVHDHDEADPTDAGDSPKRPFCSGCLIKIAAVLPDSGALRESGSAGRLSAKAKSAAGRSSGERTRSRKPRGA